MAYKGIATIDIAKLMSFHCLVPIMLDAYLAAKSHCCGSATNFAFLCFHCTNSKAVFSLIRIVASINPIASSHSNPILFLLLKCYHYFKLPQAK